MANRTTTIEVNSKGLAETIAQAERLDKLLTRLEAKASSAKKRTGAASSDAALFSAENSTEAGLTRGTAAGANRGDSRDFARQAQGLGGLVHVYATFAANVFAVSAAFNALSKAADFTIMQKSADILSGQFGLALSNTAKGLRDITDGAISARQSLEMVNMGATAGINTKQMEGLTLVAKGASMALGRDLTDAMNRVFKGAIKIEPELLDELGIMVKVAESSKEYARSLNKSALELTDFEKRQAFVNAVVKQGADKYSELTGQVNPYTKLLAKISDIGMTAGAAINSVVSPVLNLLNSSTLALAGGLTSIVSLLLGMAVPAIRNYALESKRANQEKLAGYKAELDALKRLQEEFKKTGSKDTRVNKNILEATAIGMDLDKVFSSKGVETKASTKKLYDNFISSSGEAGEKAGTELLKALNRQIKSNNTTIAKYTGMGLDTTTQDNNARVLAELHKLTSIAVNSIKAEKAEFEKLAKVQQSIYLKREADLAVSSAKAEKLARIATITEGLGLSAGWKQLGIEMNKTTGSWEKFKLSFTGGASILSTKILGLVSTLGTVSMVVGVLSTIGGVIATQFGWITDKGAKSSAAVDKLTESSKALQSSVDGLSKAGSINKIFEFNKGLAGNALESMKSLIDATEKLQELRSKGGWLERGWEGAKSLVGLGDQNTIGKQTGNIVGNLTNNGLMTDIAAKYGFKDTTKTIDATKDGGAVYIETTKALDNFKKALETDVDLQNKVTKELETQLPQLEKLNNAYQNLESSLKNVKNFSQDYINSLMPQSNEGKLLSQFSSASASAMEAYKLAGDVTGVLKQIDASADTLYAITGEKLPSSLQSLVTDINKVSDNLAKDVLAGKKTKESAKSELSDYIKTNIGQDGLQNFANWTVNSTAKLQELASITSSTTIAIAGISATLRKNAFFEGLSGKTEGTVAERQKLDAAIIRQQMRSIQQEVSTLSRIREQQLAGGRPNPEEGYKGRAASAAEFNDLGDVQDKMKDAAKLNNMGEVIRLQGIYQGMVNTEIALGSKNAQLYALKAQILDSGVAKQERILAKNATSTEIAKVGLDTEAALVKEKQSTLDVEYSIGKLTEETYGSKKRALEVESLTVKYKQDTLDILRNIATQEETIKNGSASSESKKAANLERSKLQERLEILAKGYTIDIEARIRLENAQELKDRLKDTVNRYDLLSASISNIVVKQELFNSLTKESVDSSNRLQSAYSSIYANLAVQMNIVAESKLTEVEKTKQLLELDFKRTSVLKDQIALRKIQLEDTLKLIELGKSDPQGWGKAAAETLSNSVEDRMKSMVSSTKTLVDGVFGAVDSSIDKLGDMMMKQNVTWKELKESLRENLAKALRDTLVNSMKNSFTNLMSETHKLFGMQTSEELVKNAAAEAAKLQTSSIISNTENLITVNASLGALDVTMQALINKDFSNGTSNLDIPKVESSIPSTTDTNTNADLGFITDFKAQNKVSNNFMDSSYNAVDAAQIQLQASGNSSIAASKISTSGTTNLQAALQQLGASDEFSKGVGQWGNAAFGFLGNLSTMLMAGAGGGGKKSQWAVLGGNILNGVLAGVKSYAGSSFGGAGTDAIGASAGSSGTGFDLGSGMGATSTSSGASVMGNGDWGSTYRSVGSGTYGFAKGGIMSEYGPLRVQKYASGGIATGPQMAVYGEGRKHEAFVPLPDNRSIPVTMTGGGGDVNNVTVSVTVNNNGTSETKTNGADASKSFGQQLSRQITSVVQEEIVKATRPGGLLYNR